MSDVEDYLAARAVEYGTYVATQTIYYNGVRAYNVGYPVPVSNVEKYGYLEQGLVRELSDSEKSSADDPPPRRVIIVCCEGEPSKASTPDLHPHRVRLGHERLDLDARFVADPRFEPEHWAVEGSAVEVQKLVHPDDATAEPGMLAALGHQAWRFVIRCSIPGCPRKVDLGDRLGHGYNTMLAAREADAAGSTYRTRADRRDKDRLRRSPAGAPVPPPIPAPPVPPGRPDIALAVEQAGPRPRAADERLHVALTRWADIVADSHGVSRLPLSALDLL